MTALAQFTGGRVFDGRKVRLASLFKEIRGYQ
jgi:Ca-activated chloride channel family protein